MYVHCTMVNVQRKKRTERLEVRLHKEEKRKLQIASKKNNVTASVFVRESALQKAKEGNYDSY